MSEDKNEGFGASVGSHEVFAIKAGVVSKTFQKFSVSGRLDGVESVFVDMSEVCAVEVDPSRKVMFLVLKSGSRIGVKGDDLVSSPEWPKDFQVRV